MDKIKTNGVVPALITIGALIVIIIWGSWQLIDWVFIDDSIRVTKPIVPEMEIVVKDNVTDTIYVYQKP